MAKSPWKRDDNNNNPTSLNINSNSISNPKNNFNNQSGIKSLDNNLEHDDSLEPINTNKILFSNSNVYIPPKIDKDQIPEKIKMDFDTDLELFLMGSTFIFLIVSVILLAKGFGDPASTNDPKVLETAKICRYLFIPSLILTVLSFFGWRNTDNYYIIDTLNLRVLYHFKFLNFIDIKEVGNQSTIYAFAVTAVYHPPKKHSHGYWEYILVMVNKLGQFTPLTKWYREDTLYVLNNQAEFLAGIFGCYVGICPENRFLKIKSNKNQIEYLYYDQNHSFFINDSLHYFNHRNTDRLPYIVIIIVIATVFIIIGSFLKF